MSGVEGRKSIELVVVGGGTAGWLSALMLQAEAKAQNLNLNITLIESSKVPTIGVGEGTTSIFGSVLQTLGINENEFLANTDATIKYGIRHRDWRKIGHYYDGPIDDVYQLTDHIPGAGSWIDTFCVAAGRPVTQAHVFASLMVGGKAPVADVGGKRVSLSQYHHAYHFDQAKVGAYLRSKANGIKTIDALVNNARKCPETGNISSLILDTGETVQADFFIDCTGFRRLLISEIMGVAWTSYGDTLPVNRAMPFWLELKDDEEIPTFTHAWAQKSGWMWQIPTTGRIGCGYVYSDRHVSPDQAHAEIESVLGQKIVPRNDIIINAGRVAKAWKGNVLALGLASSFLEPLEATSIHGSIVATILFARRHLSSLDQSDDDARDEYNAAIAGQVDDFRDFINLHYVSERNDSPFWRDVATTYIQASTREKLAKWQKQMPSKEDFKNDLDGLPHVEELLHYPVLDGLGLLNREVAKAVMSGNPKVRDFARLTVDHLSKQSRQVATKALSHRAWLRELAGLDIKV